MKGPFGRIGQRWRATRAPKGQVDGRAERYERIFRPFFVGLGYLVRVLPENPQGVNVGGGGGGPPQNFGWTYFLVFMLQARRLHGWSNRGFVGFRCFLDGVGWLCGFGGNCERVSNTRGWSQ